MAGCVPLHRQTNEWRWPRPKRRIYENANTYIQIRKIVYTCSGTLARETENIIFHNTNTKQNSMAKQEEAFKKVQYSVSMRKNPMRPEDAPKAYANLQLTGIVSLTNLAKHIKEHGSPYSRDVVVGVMTAIVDCTREFLLQGYKVDLGEIGQFYPSIEQEGAETKQAFSSDNITDYRTNYVLGSAFDKMRREVEFEKTTTRRAQAAALKAESEGLTQADWTPEEDENEEP